MSAYQRPEVRRCGAGDVLWDCARCGEVYYLYELQRHDESCPACNGDEQYYELHAAVTGPPVAF